MTATNTIEAIENVFWKEPEFPSYLVNKCHALRKKDIALFEVEDYRILIGHNIALEIIMPGAMSILRQNLFAEGDYYEGDLLKVVLTSDQAYWNKHPDMKQEIISLFDQNQSAMNNLFAERDIQRAFDAFTK
jgi:hypothetical protein